MDLGKRTASAQDGTQAKRGPSGQMDDFEDLIEDEYEAAAQLLPPDEDDGAADALLGHAGRGWLRPDPVPLVPARDKLGKPCSMLGQGYAVLC